MPRGLQGCCTAPDLTALIVFITDRGRTEGGAHDTKQQYPKSTLQPGKNPGEQGALLGGADWQRHGSTSPPGPVPACLRAASSSRGPSRSLGTRRGRAGTPSRSLSPGSGVSVGPRQVAKRRRGVGGKKRDKGNTASSLRTGNSGRVAAVTQRRAQCPPPVPSHPCALRSSSVAEGA